MINGLTKTAMAIFLTLTLMTFIGCYEDELDAINDDKEKYYAYTVEKHILLDDFDEQSDEIIEVEADI